MRISPALWGNPQLWGSVHPVGKGVHADTHAHGHTHSHPVVHGGSQTHTPRHTRPGGLGSKKVPPVFGSNEPLCWCPCPPLGFPREPSPVGCGDRDTGHSSVFLVQTHCLPAIPRHILFNNLSLLNYLLAFTTSPPPPCPPLSPFASSHKSRKWKPQKMRHQYICK